MRKRIATLCVLIAALCLGAMPTLAFAADGTVAADDVTWSDGAWSVTSSVELANRVEVQGKVTLVLGAGTTLTAPRGITVDKDNTLTITGTGTLEAGPTADGDYGLAGIGASVGADAGTIVIKDGIVIANGGEGPNNTSGAAGIGGSTGSGRAPHSGIIRIEGGTVKAYGGGSGEQGQGAAGIGGENGGGANVTITGGTVFAKGGSAAAAIGAGNDAGGNDNDVEIAISGGTVDVGTGTIGGDWRARNVAIAITGGQVTGIIGANSLVDEAQASVTLGWSEVSDFIDARYPNASVTFSKGFRRAGDADKRLVAAEEAQAFSEQTKIVPRMVVVFEANGGTPNPADYVADDGGKVAKPDDPTKDGCLFDGWYRDEACTQPFSFESDAVDGDTILYAKWTALHTMAFNSNGGTVVESQVIEHGMSAARPTDPTREGYTFEGWYEDEGLTTVYDFTKPVEAGLTLYAKWLPKNTPEPTKNTSRPTKNSSNPIKKASALPKTGEMDRGVMVVALVVASICLVAVGGRRMRRLNR